MSNLIHGLSLLIFMNSITLPPGQLGHFLFRELTGHVPMTTVVITAVL